MADYKRARSRKLNNYLSDEEWRGFARAARARGVSMSALFQELGAAFAKKYPPQPLEGPFEADELEAMLDVSSPSEPQATPAAGNLITVEVEDEVEVTSEGTVRFRQGAPSSGIDSNVEENPFATA